MGDGRELDVRDFLASPRHAFHFRESASARAKIEQRRVELLATGKLRGKIPIVNLQLDRGLVEVHDGNASTVAWLLYADERGTATTLGELLRSFEQVIVLENRRHPSGEVWHPLVPPEVRCADRLQTVADLEQGGRVVRKALTLAGEPAYFDDLEFFSGPDACEPLGAIADALRAAPEPGTPE